MWFEKFGAARDVLVVGDKPAPVAGPGEVLVKSRTSGVNPSDVKKRAGSLNLLDDGYVIPNSDGAGVIEAVGAGVDAQRVVSLRVYQAQFGRRFGMVASTWRDTLCVQLMADSKRDLTSAPAPGSRS